MSKPQCDDLGRVCMHAVSGGVSGTALGLRPSVLVMQPTTLCNLNCRYCYLPDRGKRLVMPAAVNRAAAEAVARWRDSGHQVEVLWHAGEPLTVGVRTFEDLLADWPAGTLHHIQTNATLIDEAWCDLFHRHHVRVSASIDGPEHMNSGRVTRSGAPAWLRITAGITMLRRQGIPFDVLSVVQDPAPEVEALTRDPRTTRLGQSDGSRTPYGRPAEELMTDAHGGFHRR
ncbi:radical SAM protein [Streptomyces sp. DT199]|uniref:radical SAM protein n=1 Tax=Streptomyces sp. DT199 TaxID=3393421 RepID=UPI003CF74B95